MKCGLKIKCRLNCSPLEGSARKHWIWEILPAIDHTPSPPFSGNPLALRSRLTWLLLQMLLLLLFRVDSPVGEQYVTGNLYSTQLKEKIMLVSSLSGLNAS